MIRVSAGHHVFALSGGALPAARVSPGETIELETADCFAGQVPHAGAAPASIDWNRINPATGPVYVVGARPGDVVSVSVERIAVAAQGVMAVSPEFGVLADRIAETSFALVPIADGRARLPGGVRVPVRPMIGVLGVAPAGEPVSCGSPGPHGGNMDTRLIAEGSVVHLPVAVEGALLAAGDLHAVMGDGEICGTGVEVGGSVSLRVDVNRDLALSNPVVETAEVVATVASAETLDEAAEAAVRDMADLLRRRLDLGPAEATMLMSAIGQLRVSQVVDPLKTARFELPKEAITAYGRALV